MSPHPKGTFFIENVVTKRRFSSYISRDLPDIPLFLWPLFAFDPNYPHGRFNIEPAGCNHQYFISNILPAQPVRYIAHNAPFTPILSSEQQTCRLIPTGSYGTYFVSTSVDGEEANGKPLVITDYHPPEDPTGDLPPSVEPLNKHKQTQMWILKQV